MRIVVLDAATLGPGIDLTPLYGAGQTKVFDLTAPEELSPRIADAEVIVTNKWKLNRENLKAATALKLICVTATGYDNIDLSYCRERGIAVCNVPAYSTESVAQLTLTMVLSLAAHLKEYRDYVSSGAYSASGIANLLSPVWQELAGKTWGIVGGGNIGRRVARLAEAFGCRVLMHRRKQETEFEGADLHTLCRESDIISVHVPLTEDTRGMIGKTEISLMKQGVIFINVARGAVCDEGALAEAVESGHIGALGVDVFSVEPFPKDHPFSRIMKQPNVCLTPHIAWGALETRNRCIRIVAENILAFRQGKRENRVENMAFSG
jgi:glycerate dehydrogenase